DSDEWLVAGYALGRRARNALWWRPREALGLGTTISGCGFFIEPGALTRTLQALRTLTEDLETTARLYAEGHRVAYVSSTFVRVGEPNQLAASVRQRSRWARGHLRVLLYEWPRLVRRALGGDARAFDMAVYLAAPTRLLTRTMLTLSLGVSLLQLSFALPLTLVTAAFCGEWLVPAYVSLHDHILPANRRGLSLAVRHGVLSLLWFPIGLWAAVTPWSKSWHVMPRPANSEETADASAAA
ncbi:MAG: glycosyltransferase family 2 protein, partial [Tepidiformaceae bacterium]